ADCAAPLLTANLLRRTMMISCSALTSGRSDVHGRWLRLVRPDVTLHGEQLLPLHHRPLRPPRMVRHSLLPTFLPPFTHTASKQWSSADRTHIDVFLTLFLSLSLSLSMLTLHAGARMLASPTATRPTPSNARSVRPAHPINMVFLEAQSPTHAP